MDLLVPEVAVAAVAVTTVIKKVAAEAAGLDYLDRVLMAPQV
jgi:hypothetical protein